MEKDRKKMEKKGFGQKKPKKVRGQENVEQEG